MKDIPTSPRIALIKRKRRARKIRLVILFVILFFVSLYALSYFSSDRRLTINKITITGNSILDAKDLDKSINEKLSGKYWGLFAHSHFLIYPNKKIYNSLLKDFPRIKELSLKLNGLNTLDVDITERSGSYLYCGESVPDNTDQVGENCYFVNNDGYIFDKAPYFSGNVYFKYYLKLNSGDENNPLGVQMLPKDEFHKLVRFEEGIEGLGFKPAYLVIDDTNDTYSLYLKKDPISTVNPRIIFKKDNDLPTILDNFSIAMNKSEFANEINSKYAKLTYIDLRFTNKVLYKFD